MAKPRKRPPTVAVMDPDSVVSYALASQHDGFAIVAGGIDRFGAEAMSSAVVARLLQAEAVDRNPGGLALLVAQVGVVGAARAAIDHAIAHAVRHDPGQTLDLLMPLACSGIPLDSAWFAGLSRSHRELLADIVCPLAAQVEPLLAYSGSQRQTTIEETRRVILGT